MSGTVGDQNQDADPTPVPSGVGLSRETFSVDASGEATFSIPVDVAPGIAGFSPKLKLAYRHRRPNGIMGVGWSCDGLSAITRMRATYAVDGFTGAVSYGDNDRFALDGQRLINITGDYGMPGTVYYTELQSWNHVRESNGGFIVTARNGTTMEYGMTTDSRIMASGGSEVRVWALNAIADRNGNRIEFDYAQAPVPDNPHTDVGGYYPTRIRYSVRQDAPARNFVEFDYEARPDPITFYVGGYPIVIASRLKRITTSIDTTQGRVGIRSYGIHYDTGKATGFSRIVSITESGAGGDGLSFIPARLVWQDTDSPGFDINGPVSRTDQPLTAGIVPMDVSGNGRTDVVQLWPDVNGVLHASTYLATPRPDGLHFLPAPDSTLGAFPGTRHLMPVDLDGDGRTDLLIAYQDMNTRTLMLAAYLSNGMGFVPAAGSPFDTGDPWDPESHVAFFAMDANGDGRTDLVEAYGQGDKLRFRTYLSRFGEGAGFAPGIISSTDDPAHPAEAGPFWAMDVNGDGLMDLVRVWRDVDSTVHATAYVSVCTAIDQVSFASRVDTNLGIFSLADRGFLPVDVNGDGVQDLLHVWRDASGRTLHLSTLLTDAAGRFVLGPDTAFPDQTVDLNNLYPMGLNGGGQVVLVSPWTTPGGQRSFTIFVGSPSGTFRALPPTPPIDAPVDAAFLLGDPDGNGKADLIQVSENRNRSLDLVPYLSTGPCNDVASSITNALGGSVSIQYAPISDASVYAATEAPSFPGVPGRRYPHLLTPTQFPVQSVLGQAIQVVRSYRLEEDSAASRFPYGFEFAITYSDAQINLLGRGWQGFREVRTTNLESGRVTTLIYHQDFPRTGMVAESRIEADGGHTSDPRVPKDETVLMRRVATSYDVFPRSQGRIDGQRVVEVLPTSSRHAEFDYGDDNFDFETRQSFEYDTFGNLTRHVNWGYVDRASGRPLFPDEVVYRYNSYENHVFPEGGWALGFLRFAKTSANDVDSDVTTFLPGDLRLGRRTYTSSTYNLASEARWDDSNNVFLATGYDYDGYGNPRSQTAPGGFVTHYTYDPDYHAFPASVTSPPDDQGVSLVTRHGYDPRFGAEVARQEPNGSVFIRVLDELGRKTMDQGPIPDFPGAFGDPNALTPLVTGSSELRQIFLKARTLTLATTSYQDDGQGGQYAEVRSLQRFPDGVSREFLPRRSYVDGLARQRESFQAGEQDVRNTVVLTVYDSDGNPLLQSLPFFSATAVVPAAPHAVLTSYDVLGRPLRRREPAGPDGGAFSTVTWRYGRNGRVRVVEAAGSDVAYTQIQDHHLYDSKDAVRRTVVPSDGNATTLFRFDRLGRLVEATDPPTSFNPRGVTSTTTYDSLDRRSTIDNPDQNTTGDPTIKAVRFEYDRETGRLARRTDAAQQATFYTYDALGRVTGEALPDGSSVARIYDEGTTGLGQLTRVTLDNADRIVQSQYVLGYDSYGNNCDTSLLVEGESSAFVTRSVFDPQRRVVRQTLPDGSTIARQYAYGSLVRLWHADVAVAYPLDHYHPTGRPGRLVYGNGTVDGGCVVNDRSFNPAGLLYRETLANGSGTILDESYEYDLLSQILRIGTAAAPDAPSQRFLYASRRLAAAWIPGFAPAAFDYDASGNLVSKDGVRYDFRAHFAVAGTKDGGQVYSASADACGRTKERTAHGVVRKFAYDGLGCLGNVAASDGASVSRMLNDHSGRRLRQTDADGTTIFFVDPSYRLIRAADGTLSATRYLHDDAGPVAAIAGGSGAGTCYLRRDHKGSITHLFDTDGSLASVIGYGAYGEFAALQGVAGSGPKYESRFWSAPSELYYFGARYYDPMSGRFLTPDTVPGGSSILQAGVLNRYAFELNNPILYVDPDGHSSYSWWVGLAIGATLVLAGGALIVFTGGAATPIVAGALISAGLSGSTYALIHHDSSFDWRDYLVETGVGAAVGAAGGAAFSALGARVASLATQGLVGRAAAWSIVGGGALNAGLDASARVGANLIEGAVHGNFHGWSSGVLEAAVVGGGLGALGGGLSYAGFLKSGGPKYLNAFRNEETPITAINRDIENIEFTDLVPGPLQPPGKTPWLGSRPWLRRTLLEATYLKSAAPQSDLKYLWRARRLYSLGGRPLAQTLALGWNWGVSYDDSPADFGGSKWPSA